jgi:SAM-dependent methyltransferase
MKVADKFFDKDTGEQINYTSQDRLVAILDDWKTKKKEIELKRYQRYLDKFKPETKDKVVLDIGCGAFGGVLSLIEAKEKVAIDSLISYFKGIGIWDYEGKHLESDAKKIDLPDNYADVIFCLNALDHCFDHSILKRIVGEFKRLLKPGGKVYIHFHLRKEEQVNLLHLYSIEEKDVDRLFPDFRRRLWEFDGSCIVWERPYKTFWGILEKL